MKKIVYSIFIGMLLSLLLVGCGSESTTSEKSSNTSDSKSNESTKEQENSEKDTWPNDSITIILPYSAGGTSDVLGRSLAPFLEEALGQKVIVINKPGGSGSIAMNAMLAEKPDGYTISMTTPGPSAITPMLNDVGYVSEDLLTIGQLANLPYVFTVPADSPYNSVKEFFDAAKENPNQLKVGTPGATTSQAVIATQFEENLGLELNQIPFDGGAKTMNALLGGKVDATLNLEREVVDQIRAGELKGLAISEKSDFLPDVPTFKEQGIEIDIYGAYYGLAAPKGTPQNVIDTIDAALKKSLENQEVKDKYNEIYITPVYSNSKDFRTLIDNYIDWISVLAK